MHLIAGEETAEVEGCGGEAIGNEPLAHLSNHVYIVINIRDDEVCQFYPYTCIPHSEDGVEDRLEMSTTNTLIDVVTEGFQV